MDSYIIFKKGDKKPLWAIESSKSALSFCYKYLKEHPRTLLTMLIESRNGAKYVDIMWTNVAGKRRIIAYGTRAYTLNPDGSRDRYLNDVSVSRYVNGKVKTTIRFEYA